MGDPLGEEHSVEWRVLEPARVRRLIACELAARHGPPTPLGSIALRPHQVAGARLIERALARFGGALLADDVGMGKTFTALAVHREARRVVVVAPAALRSMWLDAAKQADRSITILSHEQLSAGRVVLPSADFVIVDEAHHARNPRTRRYDALARLTRSAPVLLLTATPLHNREREVRHLLALFLGQRAHSADDVLLRACTVRRTAEDVRATRALPSVAPLRWLALPHRNELLHTLTSIPAPVPPRDGGAADALLGILLIRLWCSSQAALRGALRRMLMRASALSAALQEGHYPNRAQLGAWQIQFDGLQLAFASLVASEIQCQDVSTVLARIDSHVTGVRRALDHLAAGADVDAARAHHLAALVEAGEGVVAFTQFAETAQMLFRRLQTTPGLALLTAAGGLTATGRVQRDEIIAASHPSSFLRPDPRFPIHVLISTDLLSEGVNLAGLRHVLHVDLPWTPARAHQRVGRLRREDSPHSEIRVSAFELPAPADEVIGLLRILQAKARASGELVGAEQLVAGVPWAVDALTGAGRQGRLEMDAVLRSTLVPWLGVDDGVEVDDRVPALTTVRNSSLPSWIALGLARVDGAPRLVLVTEAMISEDPQTILRHLQLFEGGRGHDPDAVERALERIGEWRSQQTAALAVLGTDGGPSAPHVRLLHVLAGLESSLSRAVRMRVGPRLTAARRMLVTLRGAGAERALAEALDALRTDTNPMAPVDAIEALARPLRVRDRREDSEPELLALIVATPI